MKPVDTGRNGDVMSLLITAAAVLPLLPPVAPPGSRGVNLVNGASGAHLPEGTPCVRPDP